MKIMTRTRIILIGLAAVALLSGCGAMDHSDMDMGSGVSSTEEIAALSALQG